MKMIKDYLTTENTFMPGLYVGMIVLAIYLKAIG